MTSICFSFQVWNPEGIVPFRIWPARSRRLSTQICGNSGLSCPGPGVKEAPFCDTYIFHSRFGISSVSNLIDAAARWLRSTGTLVYLVHSPVYRKTWGLPKVITLLNLQMPFTYYICQILINIRKWICMNLFLWKLKQYIFLKLFQYNYTCSNLVAIKLFSPKMFSPKNTLCVKFARRKQLPSKMLDCQFLYPG